MINICEMKLELQRKIHHHIDDFNSLSTNCYDKQEKTKV